MHDEFVANYLTSKLDLFRSMTKMINSEFEQIIDKTRRRIRKKLSKISNTNKKKRS